MQKLATALINLAAFIELSDDGVIDPGNACRALEQLGVDLSGLSEVETAALREARDRLLAESTSIPERNFLLQFMTAVGIEEDEEAE